MPIKVPDNLPAKDILTTERIFIMNESRAYSQDIRPLKIAILNLMPDKQETEVQLLRVLSNTPLQIDVTLLHMETHESKNTSVAHLREFYTVFTQIKDRRFDGMIITGAPIEHLQFEDVDYWNELTQIMDWTTTNVTSTLYICWAAQAGLYHHYNVPKYDVSAKVFGVFPHERKPGVKLFSGFDDTFFAPHSRHTEIRREDILKHDDLEILSESKECGVYIAASKDSTRIFVTGHSEYDADRLKKEYLRDVAKGDKISVPKNYFPNDDPSAPPIVTWRAHANLLFTNWLNYYVYQETPYHL